MKNVDRALVRGISTVGSGCIPRMRLPLAFALVMAFGGAEATAQESALQVDWIQSPLNGPWYGVDYTARSWPNSEDSAVSFDGYLATISAQVEKDLALPEVYSSYESSGGIRIGLTDVLSESQFLWSSGEVSLHTAWKARQPNTNGVQERTQACSEVLKSEAGQRFVAKLVILGAQYLLGHPETTQRQRSKRACESHPQLRLGVIPWILFHGCGLQRPAQTQPQDPELSVRRPGAGRITPGGAAIFIHLAH